MLTLLKIDPMVLEIKNKMWKLHDNYNSNTDNGQWPEKLLAQVSKNACESEACWILQLFPLYILIYYLPLILTKGTCNIVKPPRWRSGLERSLRMQKDGCSNPSRNRPVTKLPNTLYAAYHGNIRPLTEYVRNWS